uniref:Uncharacterized protein n=1 Tax=Strigamia maritima TaxID=126957 RepID=T1IK47_STRMM
MNFWIEFSSTWHNPSCYRGNGKYLKLMFLMISMLVITRLKQIDLEEIIKRQEMEISSFEQQIVYYESNHSMKIQDLENNFDNLKEIIKRQNMEISLFKQQMVYHESNHSMKIQDLESNFVAEILDRQSNSSKQIQKLLETSELKTRKLTKQQNENSVKIENCEKFLTTISTANNELAMAVAEDKKMLSNKIDKLENICDQQQNEMKGKLGKLEKQTEKQIEEIEMDLSNKIDELENICHQQQFRMRGIVENRIKK